MSGLALSTMWSTRSIWKTNWLKNKARTSGKNCETVTTKWIRQSRPNSNAKIRWLRSYSTAPKRKSRRSIAGSSRRSSPGPNRKLISGVNFPAYLMQFVMNWMDLRVNKLRLPISSRRWFELRLTRDFSQIRIRRCWCRICWKMWWTKCHRSRSNRRSQ